MAVNINHLKGELLFVPLGGSGEIGMNVNLYHLDGKWLMVDLGAGFADDWLPGIDMIVADISFISKRKNDLLGLILTHAHEDHLGAVQYLWDELRCPIYATPFTAAFLKEKLADSGFRSGDIPIHPIPENGRVELGPFSAELVHITHSVPEMNAVFLRTPYGNIMHTGDWKLDPNPLVGPATNEAKLKALGDEGVLAMVCDSTNVFSAGHSGSEGELRKSLIDLIHGCKEMVAVTTFASNVARLETFAKAAEATGRRLVLAGRSIHRIVRAAQAAGYLQDMPPPLDTQGARNVPRNKLLLVCTGCQGEPLAATNKLATDTHPDLRLRPGDTFIFSSKIIPGNEKRIFRLFNILTQKGVELLTEKDHFVHVSGHPNRDELQRMYELIRPQISVPVHGELVHMHEHVRLAKEWGVKKAIQTKNGEIIRLAPDEPECIGMVEQSGYFGIDGYFLLPPDGPVLRMRRRIQREGVVTVTLILGQDGRLKSNPVIFAPGALDEKDDADLFEIMIDEIRDVVADSAGKSRRVSEQNLENVARSAIRRIFKKEVGKNPPIEVKLITLGA